MIWRVDVYDDSRNDNNNDDNHNNNKNHNNDNHNSLNNNNNDDDNDTNKNKYDNNHDSSNNENNSNDFINNNYNDNRIEYDKTQCEINLKHWNYTEQNQPSKIGQQEAKFGIMLLIALNDKSNINKFDKFPNPTISSIWLSYNSILRKVVKFSIPSILPTKQDLSTKSLIFVIFSRPVILVTFSPHVPMM